VIKATITPRKQMLGFIYQRPSEEINIRSKEYWLATIKVSLASYAAEKIQFGTTGSGVAGDFETAMKVAQNMVWRWGMGKSGKVGDFYSDEPSSIMFLSEETKNILNNDVQDILQSCIKEVTNILTEKKDILEHFAQELLKKEELEYDDIQDIFGKFGLRSFSKNL